MLPMRFPRWIWTNWALRKQSGTDGCRRGCFLSSGLRMKAACDSAILTAPAAADRRIEAGCRWWRPKKIFLNRTRQARERSHSEKRCNGLSTLCHAASRRSRSTTLTVLSPLKGGRSRLRCRTANEQNEPGGTLNATQKQTRKRVRVRKFCATPSGFGNYVACPSPGACANSGRVHRMAQLCLQALLLRDSNQHKEAHEVRDPKLARCVVNHGEQSPRSGRCRVSPGRSRAGFWRASSGLGRSHNIKAPKGGDAEVAADERIRAGCLAAGDSPPLK